MDFRQGAVIPTGFTALDRLIEGGIPKGYLATIGAMRPGIRDAAYYERNVTRGAHVLPQPQWPTGKPDWFTEGEPCWSSRPEYGVGELAYRVTLGLLNQPKFTKSVIETVVAKYNRFIIDFEGSTYVEANDAKPYPLKKHQRELLDELFKPNPQ